MERKIGEIFEINGEWYQCVEGNSCSRCDFYQPNVPALQCGRNFCCFRNIRKDKTSVIFKKLEKVGEPFERNGYMYQEYKVHTFSLLMNGDAKIPTPNGFAVIIKQNKEDIEQEMEYFGDKNNNAKHSNSKSIGKNLKSNEKDMEEEKNNVVSCSECGDNRFEIITRAKAHLLESTNIRDSKEEMEVLDNFLFRCWQMGWLRGYEDIEKKMLNLKPFDLEAAKAGKPVCTRDGRPARIICFDRTGKFPVVALVEAKDRDDIYSYLNCGKDNESVEKEYDLMMLPEKEEGFINIYRNDKMFSCSPTPYKTGGEAFNGRKQQSYLCTIKVEWEEY